MCSFLNIDSKRSDFFLPFCFSPFQLLLTSLFSDHLSIQLAPCLCISYLDTESSFWLLLSVFSEHHLYTSGRCQSGHHHCEDVSAQQLAQQGEDTLLLQVPHLPDGLCGGMAAENQPPQSSPCYVQVSGTDPVPVMFM